MPGDYTLALARDYERSADNALLEIRVIKGMLRNSGYHNWPESTVERMQYDLDNLIREESRDRAEADRLRGTMT